MALASKIHEACTRADKTPADMAQTLCVSRQVVTKWESDKEVPDPVNLVALADLLGYSIDALVCSDRPFDAEAVRVPIRLDEVVKTPPARS